MTDHEPPSVESLISEDVNAATDDAVITWVTTTPLTDATFHPIITTDQRVECRCCECGRRCLTPVEVRGSHELQMGHFSEIAGGVFTARPGDDVICEKCSTGEGDANHTLPVRERTPKDWYGEFGRVQRAVIESIGNVRDYSPRPSYALPARKWVDRTDVTRVVAEHYYDDSTANTVSASVSRALRPLIDDPPTLVGAYRGWMEYYGDKTPALATREHEKMYSQGAEPERWAFNNTAEDLKPTLQKVRFRHSRGLEAAAVYFAYRDRLEEGERLTEIQR